MNKAQLVEALSTRLGEDKKRIAATVDALLDTVYRTVQKGEKVALTGFGVFEKRDRAARTARNPATGEKVRVKKTSVPAFRAGQEFKNVVNGSKKLPKVAPAKAAAKATPAKTTTRATAAQDDRGQGDRGEGSGEEDRGQVGAGEADDGDEDDAASAAKTTAAKTTAAKKTTAKATTARKTTAKAAPRQDRGEDHRLTAPRTRVPGSASRRPGDARVQAPPPGRRSGRRARLAGRGRAARPSAAARAGGWQGGMSQWGGGRRP